MVGFQFVHVETYSRKSDSKGRSVGFVLDEAERKLGSCEHVEHPAKPSVVYGVDVAGVRSLHDERVSAARSEVKGGKSRAVRQDQHTMLTVVASHPATSDHARDDSVTKSDVDAWQQRTVDWLRNKWGDRLVSVVRHDDESHPHLHAYVLPDASDMKAKPLHPGWSAKADAKSQAVAVGLDPKAANAAGDTAYKAAMRGLQDGYWEAVGLPSGLARLGPGRRRLERGEWHAEQAAVLNAARALQLAGAARAEAAILKMESRRAMAAEESRVADLVQRGRLFVEQARAAAAAAKAQADAAEAARSSVSAEVDRLRRTAGGIVGRAKAEARRVTAEAEATAARLRSLGERLGGVWSGLAGVQRRLDARAAQRVAAAESRAVAGVAAAKAAARAEVGGELAELHGTARRAELAAEQSAKRARDAEAKLVAERLARLQAESEREDFRGRWAKADNALLATRRARSPGAR